MHDEDDVRGAIERIERTLVDLAREIALLRRELGARPLDARPFRVGDQAEMERSRIPTVPGRRRSELVPPPSAPSSDTLGPPARR